MKVILLDIDGVLNCQSLQPSYHGMVSIVDEDFYYQEANIADGTVKTTFYNNSSGLQDKETNQTKP